MNPIQPKQVDQGQLQSIKNDHSIWLQNVTTQMLFTVLKNIEERQKELMFKEMNSSAPEIAHCYAVAIRHTSVIADTIKDPELFTKRYLAQ